MRPKNEQYAAGQGERVRSGRLTPGTGISRNPQEVVLNHAGCRLPTPFVRSLLPSPRAYSINNPGCEGRVRAKMDVSIRAGSPTAVPGPVQKTKCTGHPSWATMCAQTINAERRMKCMSRPQTWHMHRRKWHQMVQQSIRSRRRREGTMANTSAR